MAIPMVHEDKVSCTCNAEDDSQPGFALAHVTPTQWVSQWMGQDMFRWPQLAKHCSIEWSDRTAGYASEHLICNRHTCYLQAATSKQQTQTVPLPRETRGLLLP